MLVELADVVHLANHQRTHGGGSLAVLWVFLGVVSTGAWLIFSELPFRSTLAVLVPVWAAVVGLSIWL